MLSHLAWSKSNILTEGVCNSSIQLLLHLTIQNKNKLWLHWYVKVTFYFTTHFYSILHSTPSWYQYFLINPTFSMLLVTLYTLHIEHSISIFLKDSMTSFCISNSAKVRKVIIIKVEKILKGSLDSIPSPWFSVKIQIMSGKVGLRRRGKTLLGVVNKLLKTTSLLTCPAMFCLYT